MRKIGFLFPFLFLAADLFAEAWMPYKGPQIPFIRLIEFMWVFPFVFGLLEGVTLYWLLNNNIKFSHATFWSITNNLLIFGLLYLFQPLFPLFSVLFSPVSPENLFWSWKFIGWNVLGIFTLVWGVKTLFVYFLPYGKLKIYGRYFLVSFLFSLCLCVVWCAAFFPGFLFMLRYPTGQPPPTLAGKPVVFYLEKKNGAKFIRQLNLSENRNDVLFRKPEFSLNIDPFVDLHSKTGKYGLFFADHSNQGKKFGVENFSSYELSRIDITNNNAIVEVGQWIGVLDSGKRKFYPLVRGEQPFVSFDFHPREWKPENETRIFTISDVRKVKKQLLDFVFSQKGLPMNRMPHQVNRNQKFDGFSDKAEVKNIESLSVQMAAGVKSTVYLFHPKLDRQILVVLHGGHTNDLKSLSPHILFFLRKGCSVMVVLMPLIGENKQKELFFGHNSFFHVKASDFSPISYFVEPVAVSLNFALKENKYRHIVMAGFSGGGWTTILYSALDERIERGYAVAGGIPHSLRLQFELGDYEQVLPSLNEKASFFDLCLMGCAGNDRELNLIFNRYDDCCFNGDRIQPFFADMEKRIREYGGGKFRIFIDDSGIGHQFSTKALEFIGSDLAKLKGWIFEPNP